MMMWGVLVAVFFTHGVVSAVAEAEADCSAQEAPVHETAQVLLQKARRTTVAQHMRAQTEPNADSGRWLKGRRHNGTARVLMAEEARKTEPKRVIAPAVVGVATNPSGAAAPLSEVGYTAVADRCCSTEMVTFLGRQIRNLGYEVCDEAGLYGVAQYHSCNERQSFDKLSQDIMDDWDSRCTYLAMDGHCSSYTLPGDCPVFPDVPPPAGCGCTNSKAATVDLTAGITNNNIGGEGPNTGGIEELRYDSAGTAADGTKFDVVITSVDSYSTPTPTQNGATGAFGRLNLNRNSNTQFKFAFVKPGSDIPVTVSEIHMTIFDLDGTESTGIEYASSIGYKGYVTDASPSITAALSSDGTTQFEAAGTTANVANPSAPNSLTADQRVNSVMFFYENVQQFYITFGVREADAPTSRNVLFAFESSLNDRCAA